MDSGSGDYRDFDGLEAGGLGTGTRLLICSVEKSSEQMYMSPYRPGNRADWTAE
jgi:hypothetical protein